MEDGENACFICLSSDTSQELGPLGRHCNCPSLYSHRSCLLRWQLQNAGRAEEKACRFCGASLTDWRKSIDQTPAPNQPAKKTSPIMAVVFQGKTVKVPVVTGPEGVAEFKRTVCKLFNLPEGTDFEVTFECKSPVFGDKLHLKGFDCFEAASYCAAVSAAKRASYKAARAAQAATSTPGQPSGSMPRSSTGQAGTLDSTGASAPQVTPTNASRTRDTTATTHQPKSCSPSLMRRLLCATQLKQQQVSDTSAPITSQSVGSSGSEVTHSTTVTSSVSTPDMAGLASMPSDAPPAVHVARAPSAPVPGTKASRPLGASITELFRRFV